MALVARLVGGQEFVHPANEPLNVAEDGFDNYVGMSSSVVGFPTIIIEAAEKPSHLPGYMALEYDVLAELLPDLSV